MLAVNIINNTEFISITLWVRCFSYPHFTEQKIEAWRDRISPWPKVAQLENGDTGIETWVSLTAEAFRCTALPSA